MLKKIWNILKNPWFIFSLILVFGIVIRILEAGKTSFWYDEAFTGDVIKLSWKDMFAVIAADKVHPPVFYVLTRLWAMIFGFTQDSLRGFSIVWGAVGAFMAYVLGRNVFDRKKYPIVGLVLAFVLAISPFFVTYSVEARAYSFLACLALATAYFILQWLDTKEKKYLLLGIAAGLLMCATHYLQIIFIIAIVCTVLIYKFVFTEKGLNKRGLGITIGILVLAALILIYAPIKAFVNSHGIVGMWWVPDTKLVDLVRVYYSYFFGVVRYANGVPPMREMVFNISPMVIATIIFVIHLVSTIFVLRSKSLGLETKRRVLFFYILGLVTFFGFYVLSRIGFNSFVERYSIAGGIILFVSFWSTLTLVVRKYWMVIPLGMYIALIFSLKAMPGNIDYRIVTKELDSINGVGRYVFTSPTDMIDSQFYMSHQNIYYLGTKDMYPGWALLNDSNGVKEENLKSEDYLVAPKYDQTKFVELGYSETLKIGDDFVVLKK